MNNFMNMNHSDGLTSRNPEPAPRFRPTSTDFNPIYPYFYPFPFTNPMVFNPNAIQIAFPIHEPAQVNIDQSNSGITSPNSETKMKVDYWQNIMSRYDGQADERPSCGKLRDDCYFTQKSGDAYLLFEKKSDYINHFITYYFSDRNLQKDKKLVDLMDSNGGVVPLSALTKFPKLNQIDTTIDDLVQALKINLNLCISDTKYGEKGIKRKDKLNSTTNGHSDTISNISSDDLSVAGVNANLGINNNNINNAGTVTNSSRIPSGTTHIIGAPISGTGSVDSNDNVSPIVAPFFLYQPPHHSLMSFNTTGPSTVVTSSVGQPHNIHQHTAPQMTVSPYTSPTPILHQALHAHTGNQAAGTHNMIVYSPQAPQAPQHMTSHHHHHHHQTHSHAAPYTAHQNYIYQNSDFVAAHLVASQTQPPHITSNYGTYQSLAPPVTAAVVPTPPIAHIQPSSHQISPMSQTNTQAITNTTTNVISSKSNNTISNHNEVSTKYNNDKNNNKSENTTKIDRVSPEKEINHSNASKSSTPIVE